MNICIIAFICVFLYDLSTVIVAVQNKDSDDPHKDSKGRITFAIIRMIAYIIVTIVLISCKINGII